MVLYVRDLSLWGPIIVHAANNLIAWLAGISSDLWPEEGAAMSVEELRDEWIAGVALLLIGGAWFVYFVRSRRPEKGWRVPPSV